MSIFAESGSLNGTMVLPRPRLSLVDCEPAVSDFRGEVIAGLSANRKQLPCKFFYDERGSRLFDQICELPEYYQTRTELGITRRAAAEIAGAVGPDAMLVEYGSGSSLKTRVLLDNLIDCAAYVPIDISKTHLMHSATGLAEAYPDVEMLPVCADYTAEFRLPRPARIARSVTAYFPGSTIGNFEPHDAIGFMRNVRRLCGDRSSLLIGVDLKKSPSRLHAAYNDAAGVTAAFNLNILARINGELGGNFDLSAYAHYAPYHPVLGRMEMHLVSLRRQDVRIDDRRFHFDDGESIFTECCYKYTLDSFQRMALEAGYVRRRVWLDAERLFSVQLFDATPELGSTIQ